MKCPSCGRELAPDPSDGSKVVCWWCRKRYQADKVSQYWEEKARLDSGRVAVGEEKAAAAQAEKLAAQRAATRQAYAGYAPVSMPYAEPTPQYDPRYVGWQGVSAPIPQTSPTSPAPGFVDEQVPIPPSPTQPAQRPAPVTCPPYASQSVPAQSVPQSAPVYWQPAPQLQYPYAYQPAAQAIRMQDALDKRIGGLGIASMCTGIAGMLFLPLICGGVALGLGIASLAKASSAFRKKSGMAIAGVALGGLDIAYWLLSMAVM